MRMGKGLLLGLMIGALAGSMLSGCSTAVKVVKVTAGAAYTVASIAVHDYCALPAATRAAGQLVLAGKVYNTGLCDVVNSDASLKAQLATATASEANTLIAAKVDTALASGSIDQGTAQIILAGDQATSLAAAEAVGVTATTSESTQTAAVIAPPATPAPAASTPAAAAPSPDVVTA